MTVNTLGSYESRPSRTVAEWLWPFVPMGVAAFSLSALIYYHLWRNVFTVSSPLQQFYAWLYRVVGFAPAVMFFGLTILWSTIWLVSGRIERPASRFLRLLAMMVMLGVFLNLGDGGVSPSSHTGVLGAWFAETLDNALGYWPSLVLVWAITFASLLLATDFFFHESFERLRLPPVPAEAGVEAAVADHLRGIASVLPAVGVRPGVDAQSSPVAPPAVDEAEPRRVVDDGRAEPPVAEPPPRRRTYAERRAERSWHRASEEEWVPLPAPESQEIDNPETRDAASATPRTEAAAPNDSESESESAAAAAAPPWSPAIEPVSEDESFRPESGSDELALGDRGVGGESDLVGRDRADAVVEARGDELDDERDDERDEELDTDRDADRDTSSPAEPWVELSRMPPLVWTDEASAASPVEPVEREEDAVARASAAAEALAEEPLVSIPRPPAPVAHDVPVETEAPIRQQDLFDARVDESLIQEAIDVVIGARRASVSFLQRKLRIDYDTAAQVLAELAARGVIAIEGDATQGRVVG